MTDLVLAVALAVIVAVAEETIFRGYLILHL
jgi:membrane protease YdiL (CAAX protease family)